jgi:hypothetical protein
LVLFALFWAGVIAALQALYSVSAAHQGIVSSDDKKHYLWTYGPTAIFVVVVVLWRQVDRAAKSIQPWAEMAKQDDHSSGSYQPLTTDARPNAKDTLLLDYVTLFQVVGWFKSLRKGHFNVFSTITVSLLIKAITIVSTSTFNLQSVQRQDLSTVMALNNTFEADNFQVASVDSRAAYVVYGNQEYNITLPVGTTDAHAVQTFSPKEGFLNGSLTYSAPVDVFTAGLVDCQSGDVSYTTGRLTGAATPVSSYYNTSVSLPGCEIHNAVLQAPDWYWESNDTVHRFGYRGSLQNVSCSNLSPTDPSRNRYMIAVGYYEGFSQDNTNLLNSSNIVCTPSYAIQSAMVTLDTEGNVQSVNLTGTARTIDGVSGIDMADAVASTAKQAYSIAPTSTNMALELDPFMTLMQEDTASDFRRQQLLDPSYLETTGKKVYGKVAAQLANLYLLTPTTSSLDARPTVEGSISEYQNRLVVRGPPIRAMQALAGAMLLLTVLMLFVTPRGVVPRSVDSIAAVAAILARSPALEARLRGTGHLDLEQLGALLAPYHFKTCIGYENGVRTFSIQMSTPTVSEVHEIGGMGHDNIGHDIHDHIVKWTRPFILRRVAISLTFLASVAAIVALEVLLSQSQTHQGLGNVDADSSARRYAWLYVPVLVFVLLGTLFTVMDFEIEFTESYHALAKGYCSARSSMLWYPLRQVSLHATWNGLQHGRFALTAASASAVLAPFLTIVVSGLFFSEATTQNVTVDATALNWFNTSLGYGTDPSTNIPALIIEGNMSYPKWTYEELALPQMKIASSETGSVMVDTPALRAGATCTVVSQDRVMQAELESGVLLTNISTPDGCGNSGLIGQPFLWLQENLEVPVNASGYFGSTLTLGFDGGSCPKLALYYGRVSADNKLDHFSAVLCDQFLERVQTNVTFDLPDLTISTTTVHPGSAMHFSDYYTTYPTLQVLNVTGTADVLDTTFGAMVYGRDGVPTAELLDTSRLIDAYTHVYRQYIAQLANIYLRADFSTLSQNATETVSNPLAATHTDPRHLRLKQSPAATQALVGVLGALAVCAVTIFVTIDMRRVLPKPMGSVAAVASLLAGSRIVDDGSGLTPRGSEFWSDSDWERSGIWQGEMFRMGWWGKFDEPVATYDHKYVHDVDAVDSSHLGFLDRIPRVKTGRPESSSAASGSDSPRSFRIDARPHTTS